MAQRVLVASAVSAVNLGQLARVHLASAVPMVHLALLVPLVVTALGLCRV